MAEREFGDYHDRLAAGLCPHPECGRKVPFGRLACPAHWSRLPITLRKLILNRWAAADYVEHRRWKTEAFRFWATGQWGSDPNTAAGTEA